MPCELPEQETIGNYLPIFDTDACPKALSKPAHRGFLYWDGDSFSWNDGTNGIVLTQLLNSVGGNGVGVLIKNGDTIKTISSDPAQSPRYLLQSVAGVVSFVSDPYINSVVPVGTGILVRLPATLDIPAPVPQFMSTRGLYHIDANGVTTAIPDGANGQILQMGVSIPAWQSAGSAGGSTGASSAAGIEGISGNNTSSSVVNVKAALFAVFDAAGDQTTLAAVNVSADLTAANGIGGIDTGSENSSTWYYGFITSDGDGAMGMIFSTSSTPNLSGTTHTYFALCGIYRNDSGSNLITFYQRGRSFYIAAQFAKNNAAVTTSLADSGASTLTAIIPPIVKTVGGIVGGDGAQASPPASVLSVASSTTGIGLQFCAHNTVSASVAFNGFKSAAGNFDGLPIIDPVTPIICWQSQAAATKQAMAITSYRI